MKGKIKLTRLKDYIPIFLSSILAFNSLLQYLADFLYLILGSITIIIFVDRLRNYLKNAYLTFSEKSFIRILIIIYGIYGFIFSFYYFKIEGILFQIVIISILIPLVLLVIIGRKYFKIYSEEFLYFYDKALIGKEKVFKDVIDPYNKLKKSKLKKIAKIILEIPPPLIIGFFICICFLIGFILALNSIFFLSVIIITLIQFLYHKRKNIDKISIIEEKQFSFLKQFYSIKGFTGVIDLLVGILFYVWILTLIFESLVTIYIGRFNYYEFFSIILIFPEIILILYILFYFFRLSIRYKHFILVYYQRDKKNIKTKPLPFGGDIAVFSAFLLLISIRLFSKVYTRLISYKYYDSWLIPSLIIWIIFSFLIILSLYKPKKDISIPISDIKRDNIRIPLSCLSVIIFISIVSYYYNTFTLMQSIIFLAFGYLCLSLFYINDWFKLLKKKKISDKQVYLFYLIPVLPPILLFILFFPSFELRFITFAILFFIISLLILNFIFDKFK